MENASNKRRFSFEKSVSSIGENGHLPVRGRIFFILMLSLYIGKRFLPFCKGRFRGINQIKEEYPLKKHFEQGAHGHVPVRGKDIFYFDSLLIYIGKRFFAFSQGAFLRNQLDKRRFSFEKGGSSIGAIGHLPVRGKGIFYFDSLLIYR
ncbi:hypothetical protein [Myroides odoratus]|uniref:hypothetical protein n=1 Tax=Myroides odoratus TaxID=256 RepID=UPI0011C0424F|nr:hypothetical protein [Myroides odoratus]QQU02547.1 hypothetical protein I6I89_11990 [Myroides odoratus]